MERQRKENTVLSMLKRQLAETEKGIRNFVDAIQQGIITESTKERLEGLERTKKELSAQIAREELLQPPEFTRDQFLFWFERMRKYDTTKLVHRRRLIDSFVNAIYLYDDRITLVFNFKDGTKTITFAELEESGLGSDINALAAPNRVFENGYSIFLLLHAFYNIEQVLRTCSILLFRRDLPDVFDIYAISSVIR